MPHAGQKQPALLQLCAVAALSFYLEGADQRKQATRISCTKKKAQLMRVVISVSHQSFNQDKGGINQMARSRFCKRVCITLILSMLLSTVAFAATPSGIETSSFSGLSEIDIQVEALMEKRASILNSIFSQDSSQSQTTLLGELNLVDMELSRLGVSFLSSSQVQEMFPETKNNKALARSGQTQLTLSGSDIQQRADIPQSDVNTWTTYRSTYTANGVQYNLQRLTAQYASTNSPLYNYGTRTITFDYNWSAGVANVIRSAASAILDQSVEDIPGAGAVLTFVDAIQGFFTGIDTTTEVDVPHISYSWANATTAVFTYVRLESQSDDYQWLSMISTKTETAVNYTIPSFQYKNSSGASVSTPRIVTGSRNISSRPSYYNNSNQAVLRYNSAYGNPLRNCVSSIQISGPESKTVQRISPCSPSLLIHCEY